MPQLSFWIINKFLLGGGPSRFMTFPVYGPGTKCNNHVANRCTGSRWASRQTCMIFLKLAKFYAHVEWHDKRIKNKFIISHHGELKESVPKWMRQRRKNGNSNMAAQTGNSYISGTTIDSIEIPTEKLGLSIMTSSKKVSPNCCDNDRQSEMAIWLRGLGGYIATSGYRPWSKSFRNTVFELAVVDSPRFAVRKKYICYGRPLSVSGRPCYILPMFFYLFIYFFMAALFSGPG